jgi:hypothetical protein
MKVSIATVFLWDRMCILEERSEWLTSVAVVPSLASVIPRTGWDRPVSAMSEAWTEVRTSEH